MTVAPFRSLGMSGMAGISQAPAKVVFICAELPEDLESLVRKDGFDVIRMDVRPGSLEDAEQTVKIIHTRSPSGHKAPAASQWIVLDGYQFDSNFHHEIKSAALRVLVIDDYNHLSRYACDILLNQNPGADAFDYVVNKDAKIITGVKYILLRRVFRGSCAAFNRPEYKEKNLDHLLKIGKLDQGYQAGDLENSAKRKKILVTMGGADSWNMTSRALEVLNGIEEDSLDVKVVLGAANCHKKEVKRIASRCRHKIEVLHSVDNMHELMEWADIAISSAGSTCWELGCMGVPVLACITSPNQTLVADALETYGIGTSLGHASEYAFERWKRAITQLIRDSDAVRSVDGAEFPVDGLGAGRVVATMLNDGFLLRKAVWSDCRMIWEWANDEDVRKMALSHAFIPYDKHAGWFSDKLLDLNSHLFVLEYDGKPVGQIRFDASSDGSFEIDFSVARYARGHSYGSRLLLEGAAAVLQENNRAKLIGHVREENRASRRSFTKAGFIEAGKVLRDDARLYVYTWSPN